MLYRKGVVVTQKKIWRSWNRYSSQYTECIKFLCICCSYVFLFCGTRIPYRKGITDIWYPPPWGIDTTGITVMFLIIKNYTFYICILACKYNRILVGYIISHTRIWCACLRMTSGICFLEKLKNVVLRCY